MADQRNYTGTLMVGNVVMECFLAADTLLEVVGCANATFSEEHTHACYELLYCRRGEGFQFVSDKAHAYAAGSVFLFAPFTTHAHISSVDYPEIRCSIRFEIPKEQPAEAERSAVWPLLRQLRQQGFFSFTASGGMRRILELLTEAAAQTQPAGALPVGGLLTALLSYVFQELGDPLRAWSAPLPAGWETSASLNQRKFLIDHFFDQLVNSNARMEDLCAQVHLSPSQLNRIIREIFGTTFKQKLIEVRIAYIKYFLKYSDMSINEIAQRTNFLENSNFSLFFKQHCGETPSQYRARERRQAGAAAP
ncbi:MAG: AraC family transcriptional regulator [Oscillospiraceae bacterium]|nr:AraC family transcriptional regulator [Oscillospiraceae bacterium]